MMVPTKAGEIVRPPLIVLVGKARLGVGTSLSPPREPGEQRVRRCVGATSHSITARRCAWWP